MRHRHAGAALTTPALLPDEAEADAATLDAVDPLRAFAEEFYLPHDAMGKRLLYLSGHSLGLQPKSASVFIEQELADWRRLGVQGHFDGARPWLSYHERAADGLAQLVGADASEVVAMNSLTVNLHLMMVSFFRPDSTRNKILIEGSAFPSDRHAVSSQLAFHGLNDAQHLIEMAPRAGERVLRTADIVARIEQEGPALALVLLPGVQYLTGQALDLAPLIAATRGVGAIAGLDLAHAIGNTLLQLHAWNADFAVWCSYKYLNAGPGAIGGCFVHERHGRDASLPRFAGWWGHDKATRFLFEPRFKPIDGAQGWQISNPPILAAAPLLASLAIFQRAGMPALRKKSIALTARLQKLIEASLSGSVQIITPTEAVARGCQLSLRILRPPSAAKRCHQRLEAAGVIADWREPDVLRIAPTPLYNSFADVDYAVDALAAALHD